MKIGTNEGKTERPLEILLRIYMQVKDFCKDSTHRFMAKDGSIKGK